MINYMQIFRKIDASLEPLHSTLTKHVHLICYQGLYLINLDSSYIHKMKQEILFSLDFIASPTLDYKNNMLAIFLSLIVLIPIGKEKELA
jgi:hypothetical protein